MTPAQLYDGILKAMNDKEAIDLIEETKSEWCKEQRENCLRAFQEFDLKTQDVWDVILNAPEPLK